MEPADERHLDSWPAAEILDAAPIVVLTLAPDGRIAYVNACFERLTGYGRAEVQGQDWFTTFLPPGDRDRIRALFETSIGGAPVRGNVNAILTRAGAARDIEWQAHARRAADGTIVGLVCIGKDVTDERRAAETARASEARLREAQRLAHIGSWELELATGRLDWSDEVFRIFEREPGVFEASYAAFLGAVHPDDRGLVDDAYRASVEARAPYEVVHRLCMPDGRIKHVRERGESFYDAAGTPVRSIGTVQDITAQIDADRRLRRILDGMGVFVILHDLAGQVVEVNRGLLERGGVARAQVLGRRACDTRWWSHAETVRARVQQALARAAHGRLVREELEMQIEEAQVLTVDVTFAPLFDEHGAIEGVIASAIDVTTHRAAQEQLHRTAALLRTVVAGAPIVMFALDRAARFTLSEGQGLASLGLRAGEVVGRAALALYGEVPGFVEAFHRALAGESTTDTSVVAGIAFETHYAPRYDTRGEIDGVIGVAFDVTERQRQERQIAAQLTEKEVLLRELHHRVKNNLQVIQSLLSLQRKHGASPEVASVLQDASARVSAMGLVHEKLYAASSDLARVDLVDYVRDLAHSLLASYSIVPGRITIQVVGDQVEVTLDRAVPCGLLLNELISNALKHAFPGGRAGRIDVRFTVDADRVVIDVRDDGVGIDAAPAEVGRASLGLRLIEGLTAQLRGTVVRSGPPGTHYQLQLQHLTRAGT